VTARIWKHQLAVEGSQDLVLHEPARILSVQVQRDVPCLWAVEDPEKPTVTLRIVTMGTGHEIPDVKWDYVGTYQLEDGAFVGHVGVGVVVEGSLTRVVLLPALTTDEVRKTVKGK